jgi:Uma2 family endonuclease
MTPLVSEPEIVYPDCDGKPMADNTLQWEWIATIKGNLDLLFANDPDVFVAGDNLIYPVEGKPIICQAPDVYVAFGRKKAYRGSYKVWKEGGIFPQVVFEVLSPNNTSEEMERKRLFYEKHGAEEYYVLDPDALTMEGYVRSRKSFSSVPDMNGFKSPRLGISFAINEDNVEMHYPGGSKFLSFVELGKLQEETAREAAAEKRRANLEKKRAEAEQQRAEQERQRAEQERQRAEQERQRAEQEQQRAEREQQRAERLAAKLRELGVDPDA